MVICLPRHGRAFFRRRARRPPGRNARHSNGLAGGHDPLSRRLLRAFGAGARHCAAVVPPMVLMMVGFSFALPQPAAAALTPLRAYDRGAAALRSRFDHSDHPPLARVLMTLSVLRLTLAELLRRRAQDERTSLPARFGTAGLPKK